MDIQLIKKMIKKAGVNTDMLLVPYYFLPYNFGFGYAFPPIRIAFEITFRCNLSCLMCPLANFKNSEDNKKQIQLSEDELTTNEIKSFIDSLKQLGTKAIMITGGEPFLRKDMLEILNYLKDKGLYGTVISNGTLIDDRIAKELVQVGNEAIAFSIDGSKDIHNRIRGNGDSFTKIYNAIDKIQTYKNGRINPKINLNFTISALNQNSISDMVDIAKDLKIDTLNLLYLFYTQKDSLDATSKMLEMNHLKPENQEVSAEIKEINPAVLEESITKARKKAKQYNLTLNFRPPLKGEEIEKRFFDPKHSYCTRCFYPWFETRLDPYGNIYPCSIDIPMGNIRNQPVKNIWNNSRYREFRKTLKKHKLLPACTKCCKLNNKFWSYLPCF